jgi:hypothetical protein
MWTLRNGSVSARKWSQFCLVFVSCCFIDIFSSHLFPHVQRCGRTALLGASANGHTAIVEVLLKAGADKEATDKWVSDRRWKKGRQHRKHTHTRMWLMGVGALCMLFLLSFLLGWNKHFKENWMYGGGLILILAHGFIVPFSWRGWKS